MAKPSNTKALPGSIEELKGRISDAIADSGLINGNFWITDTFPADGYVIIERWDSQTGQARLFRVDYTESGAEVTVSAAREVEKVYTEALVDPGDGDGDMEGAEVMAEKKRASQTKVRSNFRCKGIEEADDDVGGWIAFGVFSVFEKQDHSKDVVRKGATKSSIAKRLPKIKDHHGVTVGQATKAVETDEGLEVDFRIYPTSAGRDLATLMKQIDTDHGPKAPVEEGSIGFSAAPGGATRNKDGGYDFTEIEVWECSPVTFGDNPYTRVGLKSAEALGEMPTDELLGYAGETLRSAVAGPSGVKALHRRRVADDRDLKDAQWKAVDALVLDALETAQDLLILEAQAGRLEAKATGAQLRHTRAIIENLTELVHGRPEPQPEPKVVEPETDEDEQDGDESEDESQGASTRRGKAKAKLADVEPGAGALIDVELAIARDQFEKLDRQIHVGG